ncbi:putative sister chromatid separation protein [Aspergillus steynii IBT 23096]|uniref:Putative sister chromatid separation protein n=1 Tax=Aspergillus steynii IBT 23096 TaxID=1392250 RepID=A0A2I2GR70_9EURO|nr:putative sister chromatid separation protein [Aspergillus steynii IBT 23096]PLB55377.1 putative sister chromatid separation protein [Aspergillus steynii IBT 23096]
MADEMDYLSPGFDLNSLTVPRLRSILVNHDVSYPASAKKAQLIQILESDVLPKAKKLLRERERVRRTSEGITDMGSRATSVASDYDDRHESAFRDSMPPPPTPSTVSTATGARRGRSRMSTRASTADAEETNVPVTPSTASRRTTARSEGKRIRPSEQVEQNDVPTTPTAADAFTPRKSTARKLRRSELTPSTEPEPLAHSVKAEPKEESVFTHDNPFQSGSSPAPWDSRRGASRDSKRKSGAHLATESPALNQGLRARKSDARTFRGYDAEPTVSARSSPEFQISKMATPKEYSEPEVDDDYDLSDDSAGEEFTPEEQLALEREHADLMYPPTPQHRRPQTHGTASTAAPWLVILALLCGFAGWWRQEKIEIGFCGIGKPTWSLANTRVPEWANVLEPQCEPCPSHAFCYTNFEARCEHDFILRAHPLALGGLIPLPPTCEPDSEKARRVKAVADKAIEELRDRRAKWECGELTEHGREASGPEISESELKQEVGRKRRKGMSDAEFDSLWKGALGEVVGKEEIVSKTKHSILTLTSTSVTRLPLTCAFRRYVRLSLLAYRLPLSILVVFLGTLVYVRSRVIARRSDMARVPELVATTLDRLATQAALHARGEAREPYIPIGQLRDDVLRSELRGSRREDLWRRVRDVVEGNTNIRAAVREGRGGDVARSWEWIGGIGSVRADVEGSATRQREGNKVHFTALSENSQHPDENAMARSPGQSRKWDEGRPIY